ncbi:hypothetical protein Ccrd_012310 [Cynara cardunculus var. scolymus]|uniref:Uncharacterized protein n=1 Tax=Cynara cardunculus var. scolymus TaxID=59895 RepID=A0A103YHS5_CYNCS|nr:hypothetical protein Ccrd_012310 [Cynara cardunculus var. scolymus]
MGLTASKILEGEMLRVTLSKAKNGNAQHQRVVSVFPLKSGFRPVMDTLRELYGFHISTYYGDEPKIPCTYDVFDSNISDPAKQSERSCTVAPDSPRTWNDNRFSTTPDSKTLNSASEELVNGLRMLTSRFGCKLRSLISWWPVFLRDGEKCNEEWEEGLVVAVDDEMRKRKERKSERIEAIVCV